MFQRTILASTSLNTPAISAFGRSGLSLPSGKKCAIAFFLTAATASLALLLVRDRIGLAQVVLDDAEHLLLASRLVSGSGELARLLGGLFGELDDGLDHRLEVPVAEHHRAQHDLFGQLLGFRFDHHHGVLRAGDDEIELALLHLVDASD